MSNPYFPLPENESERLAALASYNILDTAPEDDFEELTLLASQICQTPVALISLLDDKRQWFKSIVGSDISETPKEYAFCAHTIVETTEIMVVNDARHDDRFSENPLVTGDPNVIFYAGVPLITGDGHALGSLCVIDVQPKQLTEDQVKSLKILGRQVLAQMELRKKLQLLEKANEQLLETNTFIKKFATTAAHDIKNPLSSILLTSQALQMRLKNTGDEKSCNLVALTLNSSKRLLTLVDEMMAYSTRPALLLSDQQCLDLNKLLKNVVSLLDIPHNFTVNLPRVEHTLTCSSVALEQIFINLLANAVRYNDKPKGIINILFREDDGQYCFKVSDNGMGIAANNLQKIFEKDVTLNATDRFNKKGTGLGLYTVKLLVDKLQGTIHAESKPGDGTTFVFSIKKNVAVNAGDINAAAYQQ
ncbi:sensor histidine kinase [Mucilaginibacter terrigena]|uniref:histidine kinase n=1 Tax=Mucilaginibacter terrigena TaxID=2492395 RepID=A0A4Q5LPV1_9SPHI|nr:GAF domain-containing sensor histidine kinase [Mucilaginibacter terrigena]RYU91437.1 sensor histidine kinase [Mucilaginibacter terrigena]